MTALNPRKGCTPFDIGFAMDRYWPDMDKITRITELVNKNLSQIDALLPSDARAWLMKGRNSAHSAGEYPIIGVVFVSEPPREWSFSGTYEKIGIWLAERVSKIDSLILDFPCP